MMKNKIVKQCYRVSYPKFGPGPRVLLILFAFLLRILPAFYLRFTSHFVHIFKILFLYAFV